MKDDAFFATALGMGGMKPDEVIDTISSVGQADLATLTKLPIIGSIEGKYGNPHGENRALFEGWGIVFGDKVDSLFVNATLPEGWKKVPTNELYSYLQDEKGQNRATIMYHWYDRDAWISPMQKYYAETSYFHGADSRPDFTRLKALVKDSNHNIIWESEYYKVDEREYDANSKNIRRHAEDWLNECYPGWEDYNAHW